ncbi:ftsY: signal recognition particle-docking protein FtsY [Rubrobacter radiotolerans]|uniref:Signal recognition particle receptor FtsY n=1 Tax=Rubrobacter radiotolerans TaxID=42256 RepID=A0A023X3V2_RUBRA|nr:signal recognition particle-docking protein FtsY [Rubrobacter radiotolerans]AHY46675.1 ftsY: signal recognition particle-docking protein FtsY [Rubrobacter radiotolerans]MDX5894082.1 signal recognition particle-docking protein FtsY [Rubrobacter radiotolerans]SMC05144.1 signal recognition particle-docking protein FtsY [Rubrobacter radiotolerans DSM 5868]
MGRSWRNFFRRSKKEEPEQVEAPEPEAAEPVTSEPEGALATETAEPVEEPEVSEEPVEEPEQGESPEPAPVFEEPAEDLPEEPEAVQEEVSQGWFSRLRSGLKRSRESVVGQLNAAVAEFRDADDEEFWERVEEVLIASDVGVPTTAKLVGQLEQEALERNLTSGKELRELLIEKATGMLEGPVELDISHEPTVILMVGVNGTGKTTTIGKLARFLPVERVMFAAGDTFRAAAIEQLQTWGERTGTPVIARQRGADSAAVAHEAVEAARQSGTEVLLIDTAGRLHTKSNLMAELEKVRRVIGRQLPGAPHEVLLSIDATTGQNGLRQAKMFKDTAGVTGVVLTKLDGTAKGGIALAIRNEVDLPIKLISVGEKVEDLHPFDARQFAEALFGDL